MKKIIIACFVIGLVASTMILSNAELVSSSASKVASWLPPDPTTVKQTATWLPPDTISNKQL